MDPVDWLLEKDAPGVAYLTRLRFLGESPRSRHMTVLRGQLCAYPPVAGMLERVDEAIAAKAYQKYAGAYWTLLFLADMQADRRDSRARRLAEHVLAQQMDSGGFSPSGQARWEIVCLTGNMLRALVHFGFGRHETVVRGYERLAERILPYGGVPCMVIDYHSLLPSCRMTLPQALRALAVAPDGVAREARERLSDLLVSQLLEMRVYHYVRPDASRYYKELVPLQPKGRRPKGVSVKEFKAAYLRDHPIGARDWLPKKGWLRFGFPHSYNPDLLEAMLALAEVGVEYQPVLDEALDHIEAKRGPDGRWKLDVSLNGKMLADVERVGRPSKWITLHALTVLKHFGRL
jgi:hypothetical protein